MFTGRPTCPETPNYTTNRSANVGLSALQRDITRCVIAGSTVTGPFDSLIQEARAVAKVAVALNLSELIEAELPCGGMLVSTIHADTQEGVAMVFSPWPPNADRIQIWQTHAPTPLAALSVLSKVLGLIPPGLRDVPLRGLALCWTASVF